MGRGLDFWNFQDFLYRVDGCTKDGLLLLVFFLGVTFRVKSRLKVSIEELGIGFGAGPLAILLEFI